MVLPICLGKSKEQPVFVHIGNIGMVLRLIILVFSQKILSISVNVCMIVVNHFCCFDTLKYSHINHLLSKNQHLKIGTKIPQIATLADGYFLRLIMGIKITHLFQCATTESYSIHERLPKTAQQQRGSAPPHHLHPYSVMLQLPH